MTTETKIHLDSDGKRIHVETIQDVQGILDYNAALRSMPQKSDWGRHIATIPNVILVKWMNEENADVLRMSSDEFGKFLKKKINDPDWKHLRTDK